MLTNLDVHQNQPELITQIIILYKYKKSPSIVGGFIALRNGKHILHRRTFKKSGYILGDARGRRNSVKQMFVVTWVKEKLVWYGNNGLNALTFVWNSWYPRDEYTCQLLHNNLLRQARWNRFEFHKCDCINVYTKIIESFFLLRDSSVGIATCYDFYLWVLHPVAYLSNWFFMTPSIATKFQYVNSV
jgi:hypothetical protein